MNARSSALAFDSGSNARPITYCSRELNGSLSVNIDSSQLLHVRRAIVQSGCEHVGIVKAVPLAGGTRMRLLVAVDQEHMAQVRDAIIAEVSA
jgi:hypothetical protein